MTFTFFNMLIAIAHGAWVVGINFLNIRIPPSILEKWKRDFQITMWLFFYYYR
jgi:hypothetical protein